ncbi:MAG: glycosyltransferase family 9 protein [Desulfovibrionaceae bacterium]|nr:glycosyltransferase family 9 protein [Desulfovibrionaceae bacterium]
MAAAPNLILQLQRMGDLVLSFPLFAWLRHLEPDRPLWVVAEPGFYQALLPLAPPVLFMPPDAPALRKTGFHRIINLSHRPEAARLAGELRAERIAGRVERDGIARIHGAWSLYRASLVHNNRHNRFHWADLNGLDLFAELDPDGPGRCVWPRIRPPRGTGKVGLFVGASEAAKRPEPEFWARLAAHLMRRGLHPVLLGGPGEQALGDKAARLARIPRGNLCGRFSLAGLVRFLSGLDLLVTPDTGPMHVGAWAGTLTLNLSMGPVNAWETAPFPPGHLVLRPTASCVGCWACTRADHPCRRRFEPGRVAALVHSLLSPGHRLPSPPGLRLARTARSVQGLFDLAPVLPDSVPRDGGGQENKAQSGAPEAGGAAPRFRDALGEFWRQWFLSRLGGPAHSLPAALGALDAPLIPRAGDGWGEAGARATGDDRGAEEDIRKPASPRRLLRRHLAPWQARLASELKRGAPAGSWWGQTPPLIRPLSGYLQMELENGDYQRQARLAALEHVEALREALG